MGVKIDLVRVRDRRAPGGWRYYAHLTVLGPGYASPATRQARASVPVGRLAGVDGNVSNLAVASIPAPGTPGPVLTSRVTITPGQKAVAEREAVKARRQRRHLDRSRRAATPTRTAAATGRKPAPSAGTRPGSRPGRTRSPAEPGLLTPPGSRCRHTARTPSPTATGQPALATPPPQPRPPAARTPAPAGPPWRSSPLTGRTS